jgi:hypothetical protein
MLVLREPQGRTFSLYESVFLERTKIYASIQAVSRIQTGKADAAEI